MSNARDDRKRQISVPPHRDGFFNRGEFIYDPDADWDDVRTGMIVLRNGDWRVTIAPKALGEPWLDEALSSYTGCIARHVLIDHSGLAPPRGPALDPAPWIAVAQKIRTLLRDADGHRLRIEAIQSALRSDIALDQDIIADTLRMNASMGYAKAHKDAGGVWYAASERVQEAYSRRDYLATFSDELLAKSRRIDHLIGHTGTVGSYREELLIGTLRQLLPTRYQANTGFIENSPRQLDIIVWDAARHAALFREGEVVVVSRESVRAVIEVKTTLDTDALDAALELLHDVFRTHPSVIPVFKGIFAFHKGYKSDLAIAERIQQFYQGKEYNGIIGREHRYLFQGVTAVCVPIFSFVFQAFLIANKTSNEFPRPWLLGLESLWPGDLKTAAFLSQLLDHLDIDAPAKMVQRRMFEPIVTELKSEPLVDLFGVDWAPTTAPGQLGKVLKADGAREYVKRVQLFFAGEIDPREINVGLEWTPEQAQPLPASTSDVVVKIDSSTT